MAAAPPQVRWDPGQYVRYADERQRPLEDLLARIRVDAPQDVIDVGCGPGPMTRLLADRWPGARVVGIDNSDDMIAAAGRYAEPGRLEFRVADLREFRPATECDVIVANAVLQWIPGQLELVASMAGWLRPGGVLALQVPDNYTHPSHVALREQCLSPRWRERLDGSGDRRQGTARPMQYLSAMQDAGLLPDVWQSTYLHVLAGDDPVLEWMKGTALRPVLSILADDPGAREEFLTELAERLSEAYPPLPGRGGQRTVFPFTRTFAVGQAAPRA